MAGTRFDTAGFQHFLSKRNMSPQILPFVLVLVLSTFGCSSQGSSAGDLVGPVPEEAPTPPSTPPPPASPPPSPPSPPPSSPPSQQAWQFTGCSALRESNHTLLFTGNALSTLAEGDTVYVFSQDNLCVGKSGAFSGKNFALAAWGDDALTQAKDGLASGEAFVLVLQSPRFSNPSKLTPTETEGPLVYEPNGITTVKNMERE